MLDLTSYVMTPDSLETELRTARRVASNMPEGPDLRTLEHYIVELEAALRTLGAERRAAA